MPHGLEAAADLCQQLFICLRALEARVVFRADEDGRHGLGGEESTHSVEGGDGNFLVGRMREPAWINDGRIGCVGRGDCHGAAG